MRTLRELGFTPKNRARTYQKPYPKYFDTVPHPGGFRVPDFVKFRGEGIRQHGGNFLIHINDVGINEYIE